jgi:hypothetical protein
MYTTSYWMESKTDRKLRTPLSKRANRFDLFHVDFSHHDFRHFPTNNNILSLTF